MSGIPRALIWILVGLLSATALCLIPPLSAAEPSAPVRRAEAKAPAAAEAIVSKLYSTDPGAAMAAAEELALADRRAAASILAQFICNGQPDAITDRVLEILAKIASPSAVETLGEFTRHRRASARLRAYQALASIRAPGAAEMVAQGLSDSAPEVRSAAAAALEKLGARGQIDLLFLALERGVREAAPAIGQLGDEESVKCLTGYINKIPLSTMLSGYDRFLRRADISEKVKLDIVATLGEVPVGEVQRYFRSFLASGGAKGKPALSKAMETAAARIKPMAATDKPKGGER